MSSWIGLPGALKFGNRLRLPWRRRTGGFTLLEILVAFTILSIALVGLLQAFATGMHGLGAAQASAVAVMHARSKLDEVGQVIPLEENELSGEYDDGYLWQVRIARVEDDTNAGAPGVGPVLFDVEVTVTGQRGSAFTLSTSRLGAAN